MAFPTDNPLDGRGTGIVVTPTWAGLLPALLTISRDGETDEARRTGMRELHRMAAAADMAGALIDERDALRAKLAGAVIVWDGQPEIFAAQMGLVIGLVEDTHLGLVQTNSRLEDDGKGGRRPIPGTLSPDAVTIVGEHEAAIEFLRELLPTREGR